MFALVRQVCLELSTQEGVDGVNLGVNSGVAAGQTVDHAHVHDQMTQRAVDLGSELGPLELAPARAICCP